MAESSLEAPADGGPAPQAGGKTPPTQGSPAKAGSPEDYVEVRAERDRATLLIKGSAARESVTITREIVAAKLAALKVVAGVDWKAVDTVLSGKVYDKTVVIAASTPPGRSRDAWIEEMIKIDPDVKPVVGADGHADYKNVDNIHQVKKGDVLAVKHPAERGEPGQDIHGKMFASAPVKDEKFRVGANTEVSSDGLRLIASTGGFVFRKDGVIHVGITYTIRGDVGFQTGNLHYQGDIVIQGSVTDGFTVEAEGDVTVEGNVDAAQIVSHGGSVTLKQAAFGHGKGRVSARKDIRLQSAQDMVLECGGELEVGKFLLNCKATTSILKAGDSGCSVVGGRVKAYQEIHVASLGGEGCHTELAIVDKEAEAARERLQEIERRVKAATPRLEAVEKKLKAMKALAQRAGGSMSQRSRDELKAILDVYAQMRR
ncbi:MAG TPA: FapA family protein, partial [Fibrobacteria bacterium]|nr:FapA family protein [Fibrobacteria bacterium]